MRSRRAKHTFLPLFTLFHTHRGEFQPPVNPSLSPAYPVLAIHGVRAGLPPVFRHPDITSTRQARDAFPAVDPRPFSCLIPVIPVIPAPARFWMSGTGPAMCTTPTVPRRLSVLACRKSEPFCPAASSRPAWTAPFSVMTSSPCSIPKVCNSPSVCLLTVLLHSRH